MSNIDIVYFDMGNTLSLSLTNSTLKSLRSILASFFVLPTISGTVI